MSQTIERPQPDASERAIQGLLAIVFVMVDTPVAIITAQAGEQGGRTLMTNPAFDRKLGLPPGISTGRVALLSIAPADRPRVAQAIAVQDADGRGFTLDVSLLHASGAPLRTLLTCTLPAAPELRRFRVITLPGASPGGAPADEVVAGKIRLISLAEIRILLAEEWDAVAERILAVARRVIEDHLSPRDTLRQTDDLGFVIVFANMSEDEATAACTHIGREMRRALIRAGEDAASVEVAATAIRLPAPVSNATLDRGFAAVEPPATRRPVRAACCRFDAVHGCRRGEFVGWSVAFNAAATPANSDLGALPPRLQDRLARVLRGAARQSNQADSRQSAERLFLDIDYAAFASRADADALLESCIALDAGTRARLTLLLAGIPAGVPGTRLADIAARLTPACQTIGFTLADLEPPGFDLTLFRTPIVAIDATGWAEIPEARIARLVQALHLRRAKLLVRRAATPSVARHMRALGVDLVAGNNPDL